MRYRAPTLLLVALHAAGSVDTTPGRDAQPPLRSDLGHVTWDIQISSTLAQQYFNQGVRLLYGFNFGQAIDSFRAARFHADAHDGSACPICFWVEIPTPPLPAPHPTPLHTTAV